MLFHLPTRHLLFVFAALIVILALTFAVDPKAKAAVATASGAQSTCKGQNSTQAPVRVQEAAMRCLINQVRKRQGLRPLGRSKKLDRSAKNKTDDIKRCNSFDHYACGRDFTYWFKRTGFATGCWSAAENLAWGSGRLGSARQILIAWLKSPGHRANLLDSRHRWQGIGLRKGRFQGTSRAQVWTSHFGRRC